MSQVQRRLNFPVRRGTYGALAMGAVRGGKAIGQWLGRKRARTSGGSDGNASRGSAPVGTTFQRDVETSYKRRRAPRRVKRRARKWRRNVNRVLNSDLSVNTFHRRSTASSTALADRQAVFGVSMYGAANTSTLHNDLSAVFTALGVPVNTTTAKGLFSNAYMELTITNQSQLAVFIDAYYFVCRKDVPNTMGFTPQDVFANAITVQPNQYGGALGFNDLGVTPFDANRFCSHFIITKVVRHQIPPTGNMSLTLRDRRDRFINSTDLNGLAYKKGASRGILFISEGVIQLTNIQAPVSLNFEWTRVYHVKVMRDNVATIQNLP